MILEYPLIAQAKLDGIRAQVHVSYNEGTGNVWIYSRSLKDKTKSFPDVLSILHKNNIKEGIFDGEIYGINSDGSPMKFNQFQKRINTKKDIERYILEYPCTIKIFDVLYYDGQDVTGLTQVERRKIIEQFSDLVLDEIIVNNREDIIQYHKECIKAGYEGVVLKKPDGLYLPGQGRESFKNFFKYKPTELRFDVVITGAMFGTGDQLSMLSSFNIAVLDNISLRSVGKCGGGFTHSELRQITERIMKLNDGKLEDYVCWEDPIIIEVKSEKVMRNESGEIGLRFPQFMGFREDKKLEDIDTVSMVEQYIE